MFETEARADYKESTETITVWEINDKPINKEFVNIDELDILRGE